MESDVEDEDVEAAESALTNGNGLNPNGWNLNGLNWNGRNGNGLNWNGLHTIGLYLTGASNTVTSNIQAWLNGQPHAADAFPYLVACAVPDGTSVSAVIDGATHAYPGRFGLAPGWRDGGTLSTADQEWLTACLLAHVNLAGSHVMVSFRGSRPGLELETDEGSTYNCREAAFMGNIFAGHANDVLPMMQCHEPGATPGTGRVCDPSLGSYNCASDCSATCDQVSGNFTSCNVTVNGAVRSYANIMTTFLPTDPANGCLGWGFNYTSNSATYQQSGGGSSWSWSWGWGGSWSSCSWHCGGYTPSGKACVPGCSSSDPSCAADYDQVCGTPPPWSGPTTGVSTCPAGYTTYTGSLAAGGSAYVPSSGGYTSPVTGTHHATLLGPSGSNFNLQIERWSGGSSPWKVRAISERSGSESLHYFYGEASTTYRWKITAASGSGGYTVCLKKP